MPNLLRILYYQNRAMDRLKWSKEKLRKYQLKRLRHVVNYAYTHVPFYHDKFQSAGLHPSDILTIKDLSRLPITKKAEFRKQSRENVVSNEFLQSNLRSVRTSGSTGNPLSVYMTGREDDWRKAIYMRANVSCGQKLRDKWMVVTGPHHFSNLTRFQQIVRIYTPICVSVFEDVATQLELARSIRPQILDGYSSSILIMARALKKSGKKDLRPRIVFGNAEVITRESQKFVEDVFQAPYYDQYGCGEFNRTAWHCPEKIGYHMDEDSLIAQFLDEDGNEVASGEKGQIVYTSLFNYAMPFIRYQVGDIGVPSDEECPCGRVLPLMKNIEGRRDALIVLSNGQTFSARSLTIAMSRYRYYDSIEQFRIIQKKPDSFEVLVKVSDSCAEEKVMGTELQSHLKETVGFEGLEVDINVKFVNDIPVVKSGKLMSVVSEVNKGS